MIVSVFFVIVYMFSNKFKNDAYGVKKYNLIFLIALFLAVFSYYWQATNQYDLFVYKDITDRFSVFTFRESLRYLTSRGEFLSMLYFYIVSFFSDRSIIPVIPVFVTYLLLFQLLITLNVSKKYSTATIFIVNFYFFSNFKYLMVMSGFRFWFAIVLFATFLYKVENEGYSEFWLFLPLLFHNSIILFLILYFIAKFPLRRSFILIIAGFSILVLGANLLPMFVNFPLNEQGILVTLINKYVMYFNFNFNLSNQFLLLVFEIIIAIGTLVYLKCFDLINDTIWNRVCMLVIILSALSFGNADLIKRFFELGRILMLPNYYLLVNNSISFYKEKGKRKYLLPIVLLLIVGLGGVFVQIRIWQIDIAPLIHL
uniref:EpsG family protein n=1 Tax=Erysipelothrix tonsillarum TaxID=38402 RepID=A0A6S6I6E6_9FIRM|nr:EpsG family protein [Erysipelothrix tonsillarum]